MVEYYLGDQKVQLIPSSQFVAFQVSPGTDRDSVMNTINRIEGIETADLAEEIEPFQVILVPAARGATEASLSSASATLNASPEVDNTLPVYQIPDGAPDEVMILIPQFRVQFKSTVSQQEINDFNRQHGVEVISKDDLEPNSYLLRLMPDAQQGVLDLSNLYHESDLTEYAELDPVYKVHKLDVVPAIQELAVANDPHYGDQWALTKMNVPQAWDINRGRSTIKIAILDEGVQTTHPDLTAKIVNPYDAVGHDNNQEPNSWDGHGTACAGIAAAATNNNLGIAGVAAECKILPIRIAYSSRPGAGWTTNTTWIARGIRTAVDRGADVLSNSWGGGPYSTTIRRAFQYARTSGRGGKGCVIISATGNSDRANGVIYPAKYPESLACGASNEWDERKSRTSRDGENWWGSDYGPEVDFLAPGVHIYTTDISGRGGYGSGDYYHRFNGTSSATPNASGVAALVLSVDPNLKQWEVRDILRLTARDLGSAGKDDQHGWGRIDAQKALQAASRLWWQARIRLEFLGTGQECYMRFQMFRLYNSGLNRVRINGFNIRSYAPNGSEIDRFECRPNPSGVMLPGLSPGGGSGQDFRVQGVLLKANGNRRSWSYRWRANWGYTYWRPSSAITSPAEAVQDSFEEEFEQEFEIVVDSSQEDSLNPNITMADPYFEENVDADKVPAVIENNGHTTKITITVE